MERFATICRNVKRLLPFVERFAAFTRKKRNIGIFLFTGGERLDPVVPRTSSVVTIVADYYQTLPRCV